MTKEDIWTLYLSKLKTGDPIAYNKAMCQHIQHKTKDIELPYLDKATMRELKKHLEEHEKITGKDLATKFLNLRNAFLIIHHLEKKTELLQKIKPIIKYLQEYQHLFDLITTTDTKNPLLTQALNTLNFDINLFIIKYSYLTTDTDTTSLDIKPLQTEEET